MSEQNRSRELVAQFMIAHSIATGHGDTIEDLLKQLGAEIEELQRTARNRDMWKGQCERQAEQLTTAHALLREALAALEPFSDMAGEMFSRGWDASNVAIALDNPNDPHRVTAGDFFAAQSLHAKIKKELSNGE